MDGTATVGVSLSFCAWNSKQPHSVLFFLSPEVPSLLTQIQCMFLKTWVGLHGLLEALEGL